MHDISTETLSSDHLASMFPVSVKGVLCLDDRFALLRNERDQWELPGGKLEPGEQPRVCVRRELEEELSVPVTVGQVLDSWLYPVPTGPEVVIVTYLCAPDDATAEPRVSLEHKELGLFTLEQAKGLIMPEGYKRSLLQASLILGLDGVR